MDMMFANATGTPQLAAKNGISLRNYFLPQCPKGLSGIPVWESVRYDNLYEGISVTCTQSEKPVFAFDAAAGTTISSVELKFAGGLSYRLAESGDLVIAAQLGSLVASKPVGYQTVGGKQKAVDVYFVLMRDASVSLAVPTATFTTGTMVTFGVMPGTAATLPPCTFCIGNYWSTFLQGSSSTVIDVVMDANDNVFIAGKTGGLNANLFPTGNTGYDVSYGGWIGWFCDQIQYQPLRFLDDLRRRQWT